MAATARSGGGPADDAAAHCEALVRAHDRERFLATLFAPAGARPHLLALYAYNLEIARVRETVSQPLAGEIRLQWWRDALEGRARGDAEASPVAAALLATVRDRRLPAAALVAMSEARIFDLYDDPMPTLVDLEGYAGETRGALIQLAALALAGGADPGSATAAGHAGVAQTVVAVLEAFPAHARRGQLFVPLDVLARHGADRETALAGRAGEAVSAALAELAEHGRHHFARTRSLLPSVAPEARPAFLPALALEGRLERLARRRGDSMAPAPRPAPLAFPLALVRTARRLDRMPVPGR